LVLIHDDDHAAGQHILRLPTNSDLEKVSAGGKKQQYSFTTADNKHFDKESATGAVAESSHRRIPDGTRRQSSRSRSGLTLGA
jgi:hypothetical protein